MTNDPHIQSRRDTIQAGRDVIQVGGDYVVGDKIAGNKIFNNYYGTPSPVKTTPEQRAASLAAYRQRLLEDTHYISLAGIPLPRDQAGVPLHLQMPLEQVYIRIQAIEQQKARQERERERDEMTKDSDRRDVFGTLRMMGEYFYRQGQVYAAKERPAPIDPQDALRQHHRLVILGAPGSGKSTLLRMLTRTAAQQPDGPVPILVRLRDYATYRATGSGSLRDFALDQAAHGDAVLRAALEQAPQLLWLVDALDEARGWQGAVVEQVRQLQGDFVLTSRPVGYPGGLESLTHFEVLPLVPDDVDRFLHDWVGVLAAQRKAPDGWVEERVAWLKKQLDDRPRIQALTRNPLLLTFLVVLAGDDPVRDLPTQRAELYRRYVEELLDSWESQRRPVGGDDGQPALKLGRLMGEDARQAALRGLYRTGWYLHLAYNDAMSGYDPNTAGIIAYLGPFLQTEWGCASGEARSIAKAILSFWVEAGLLDIWRVENAEYLAFRHLTFQEYAAAWGLREAYQQNAKQAWRFVFPRLHHYAWREPLVLLSTMLGQKHVDSLIRQLIKGTSRYEHDLLRDLRLATAMLGEDAPLSPKTEQAWLRKTQQAVRTIEQAIRTKRYFQYITPHLMLVFLLAGGSAYVVPGFWLSLLVVGGVAFLYGAALIAALFYGQYRLLLTWHRTDWTTMRIITDLPAGGKRALPTLRLALHHPDMNVRGWAILALGKSDDVAALLALQQVLHDPELWVSRSMNFEDAFNSHVPRLAAWALGELGDVTTLSALQQALYHPDIYVQQQVAWSLGKLGGVAALQQALHDPHDRVRAAAARALGGLGDAAAVPALQQALHNSDKGVRQAAAEALGQLGDRAALPALQQALHNSDKGVRQAAAEALGQLGDRAALPALQQALHDPDTEVRRAAAEALGRLGDAAVLSALQQALRDPNASVRYAAVKALGKIGAMAALPALQQALHGPDEDVRMVAAEALGQLGGSSILQQALHNSDKGVRQAAAEALGQLGDRAALPALQQALNDPNASVRYATVKALGKIGDPAALPALQQALHAPDENVRSAAAEALGELVAATSGIKQVRKTARALWWVASNRAIEALEKAANRLSVLEVQENPGSDPLCHKKG
jgi:HEAT repeat protein/energy-coupling factor transporter ATP-binding protein EcfA2